MPTKAHDLDHDCIGLPAIIAILSTPGLYLYGFSAASAGLYLKLSGRYQDVVYNVKDYLPE